MPRLGRLLVVVLIAGVCTADNVTFLRIDRSVIQQNLSSNASTPSERLRRLEFMYEKAGFSHSQLEEQRVPGEDVPNLLCTIPGTEYGTIVIGASLDYDASGDIGAVDWASLAMLPFLAESLNASPHRHTLVFAAFTGSSRGSGAAWYLQHLSEADHRNIRGMIDVREVGRTPPVYGVPAHDIAMTKLLTMAAQALHLANMPAGADLVSGGNAAQFDRAHIPALSISSLSYEIAGKETAPPPALSPVLPNPLHDSGAAVQAGYIMRTTLDPAAYNDTYNLLCVYVLFLDRGLSAGKKQPTQTLAAKASPPTPAGQAPSSSGQSPIPDSTTQSAPAMETSAGQAAAIPAQGATTLAAPPAATTAKMAPPSSLPSASGEKQPIASPGSVSENQTPVYRVSARLVQVDVVVEDNHGQPIQGLSAADFKVMDDGRPQQIRAFELHSSSEPASAAVGAAAAAHPALPPNVYSNLPNDASGKAWTIVLFDVLNTAPADQAVARKQLLQVLHSIPQGQAVALFVLTKHLEMLQAFTQDSDQLIKMADLLAPTRSHLLTTTTQKVENQGRIQQTATQAAPATGGYVPAGGVASFAADTISRVDQGMADHETFLVDERVRFTLAAMEGLSRAVSGYPGRKNLIWLSGSFPILNFADPALQDQWRDARNYAPELRSTSALLATSRIAVYPVDVRGLQTTGIDIVSASSEVNLASDPLASPSRGATGASTSGLGNALTTQTASMADERSTMKQLAGATGGEAFTNTNDLSRAMTRSLDNGSNYYTLAYTPPKEDLAPTFHRIQVELDHPHARLLYRTGYYAIPQTSLSTQVGTAALRGALQLGMPQSTMVLFTASVSLPDATHPDVSVKYNIRADSASFTDAADQHKRALFDCMIVAYDREGHESGHASDTLDATLSPATYESVLAHGLPASQELKLPPGVYDLRVGVMDRATQQIGSIDIPLILPATFASVPNATTK